MFANINKYARCTILVKSTTNKKFKLYYVGLYKLLRCLKSIFSILITLLSSSGFCQQLPSVKLPLETYYTSVLPNVKYYFTKNDNPTPQEINQFALKPLLHFKDRLNIPAVLIDENLHLIFSVENTSATPQVLHFYTGYLTTNIHIVSLQPIGEALNQQSNNQKAYVSFTAPAMRTITVHVSATFCKRKNNAIEPVLVSEQFLQTYITLQNNISTPKKTISYFLIGSLAMMMLYTIVNFFVLRNITFFYLFGGTLSLLLVMFFSGYITNNPTRFKLFFASYADFILFLAGIFFFIQFIKSFLGSEKFYPVLHQNLKRQSVAIIVYGFIFTILYYVVDKFVMLNLFESVVKFQLMVGAAAFTYYTFKKKDKTMQFLVLGTASLLLFSAVSFLLPFFTVNIAKIFQSPIFYFETGVVSMMVFFIMAIATQNKAALISAVKAQEAMKLQAEKKTFETQVAVFRAKRDERTRISEDMHDDLGAGITAMRLYSEMAKDKLGTNALPEIDKISDAANELLIKLNAIIWSMSTANDGLHNLIAYTRAYASEYLEDNKIAVTIHIEEGIPNIKVPGKIRRNIFLVVKEALHNTVKHAHATSVIFNVTYTRHSITVSIHDNGVGISEIPNTQFNNGVQNMKRRMELYGIMFSIKNNNGTEITLTLQQQNLFSLQNTKPE